MEKKYRNDRVPFQAGFTLLLLLLLLLLYYPKVANPSCTNDTVHAPGTYASPVAHQQLQCCLQKHLYRQAPTELCVVLFEGNRGQYNQTQNEEAPIAFIITLHGTCIRGPRARPTFPNTDRYGTQVCLYEGWNFNSGNYLFTTDTKQIHVSKFYCHSMQSPALCTTRCQRCGSRRIPLAAPVVLIVRMERSTA